MRGRSKLVIAVSLMALLSAPSLFAGEEVNPDTGLKYGSAGCGLGSMLFGGKTGMMQVLAATTNGTSYSQTFGISSGTSNCKAEKGRHAGNIQVYVEANRVALAKDVARGRGETVTGLAQLLGCRDTGTLGQVLQRNYSEIFQSQDVDSATVAKKVLNTVDRDQRLVRSCQAG